MAEQHEWDVVVLGTGAAGLTAAFTAAQAGARVGVFEKADLVGGTTAWSGGQVWIPNNPHQEAIGVEDSRERGIHLHHVAVARPDRASDWSGPTSTPAPRWCAFLERARRCEFYAVPDFPDYHPEFPGGKPDGGRTVECPLYPSTSWASGRTG